MLNLIDFVTDGGKRDQIAAGTGAYVDDEWANTISHGLSQYWALPPIVLPVGKIKFARTLHLKSTMRLIGHCVGLDVSKSRRATIVQFDPDQSGFVFHRYNTSAEGIVPPSTECADGSIIEGVRLEGSGTVGHGFWLRARATIRDCQINGFGENGVHIRADARSTDPLVQGNANNFRLDTLLITNNKGHGVYCDGGDVNAGKGECVEVTENGGWGIYDSSFLGNKWDTCHAAGNNAGPYKTDEGRCKIDCCYSESDQPPSQFGTRTLIDGGEHGAGYVGGQWIGEGRLSPYRVKGVNTARPVEYRMGMYEGAGFDVVAEGDHPYGWSLGYWDEPSKTVQFRHALLGARVPLKLTTNLSAVLDEAGTYSGILDEAGAPVGPGQLLMQSIWAQTNSGRYRKVDFLDLVRRIEALEGIS